MSTHSLFNLSTICKILDDSWLELGEGNAWSMMMDDSQLKLKVVKNIERYRMEIGEGSRSKTMKLENEKKRLAEEYWINERINI